MIYIKHPFEKQRKVPQPSEEATACRGQMTEEEKAILKDKNSFVELSDSIYEAMDKQIQHHDFSYRGEFYVSMLTLRTKRQKIYYHLHTDQSKPDNATYDEDGIIYLFISSLDDIRSLTRSVVHEVVEQQIEKSLAEKQPHLTETERRRQAHEITLHILALPQVLAPTIASEATHQYDGLCVVGISRNTSTSNDIALDNPSYQMSSDRYIVVSSVPGACNADPCFCYEPVVESEWPDYLKEPMIISSDEPSVTARLAIWRAFFKVPQEQHIFVELYPLSKHIEDSTADETLLDIVPLIHERNKHWDILETLSTAQVRERNGSARVETSKSKISVQKIRLRNKKYYLVASRIWDGTGLAVEIYPRADKRYAMPVSKTQDAIWKHLICGEDEEDRKKLERTFEARILEMHWTSEPSPDKLAEFDELIRSVEALRRHRCDYDDDGTHLSSEQITQIIDESLTSQEPSFVLAELLDNAFDANYRNESSDGSIYIEIRETLTDYIFEISDKGPGIESVLRFQNGTIYPSFKFATRKEISEGYMR